MSAQYPWPDWMTQEEAQDTHTNLELVVGRLDGPARTALRTVLARHAPTAGGLPECDACKGSTEVAPVPYACDQVIELCEALGVPPPKV